MEKVNFDTVLFVKKVLPSVIECYNKSIGRMDPDEKAYEYSVSIPDNDSFHIQELVFVDVVLDCKRKLSLVMKAMQPGQEYFANHYENEIRMYKEIIPLLGPSTKQMFPRCIYASATGTSSEAPLLVIENLVQAGYKMSKNRISLSQEEIMLALKTLGEFHGHSYALKLNSRKTFDEIVAKIQPTYFADEDAAHPMHRASQSLAAIRVIKRFLHRYDNCKRMETLSSKAKALLKRICQGNHLAFIKKFMEPREPLAVLCHGDYNRNNIMFKYADSNEEWPTDCMILDLQTIRYSSPMSDVSFLLFMNMRSDGEKPWDELWDAYHTTLVTTLCQEIGIQKDALPQYFSLSYFKEELRRYCLCSYMIAVSFLNITGQGSELMMQRMGVEYEEQKSLYLEKKKEDESFQENFDIYFYNKVTDEFDTDEIRDISDDLTMEVLNLYDESVLTY